MKLLVCLSLFILTCSVPCQLQEVNVLESAPSLSLVLLYCQCWRTQIIPTNGYINNKLQLESLNLLWFQWYFEFLSTRKITDRFKNDFTATCDLNFFISKSWLLKVYWRLLKFMIKKWLKINTLKQYFKKLV